MCTFLPKLMPRILRRSAWHVNAHLLDAYLLGLAMHKKGKLATMDRAILELLPEKGRDREFVELL
jgi:hypothetical protein